MLSEAYGGEVTEKTSVSEWYKRFKMWKMMKEVVVQDLTEPMKMLGKYRI
jgi:hypothetical protein